VFDANRPVITPNHESSATVDTDKTPTHQHANTVGTPLLGFDNKCFLLRFLFCLQTEQAAKIAWLEQTLHEQTVSNQNLSGQMQQLVSEQ
jgi:hypothetical protein